MVWLHINCQCLLYEQYEKDSIRNREIHAEKLIYIYIFIHA